MNRNIVLDTNCLLQIIAKRSKNYFLWEGFLEGKYCLCYTTDILEEYEEILGLKSNPIIASMVIEIIKRAPNSIAVDAHFLTLTKCVPDKQHVLIYRHLAKIIYENG